MGLLSVLLTACTNLSGTAGHAPSEPGYKVVKHGVVVTDETDPMVHWIFVKCDYWAGCYVRCEGGKAQCEKVAASIEPEKYLEFSEAKTNH